MVCIHYRNHSGTHTSTVMAGEGLLSLRWNNHRTSFLQVLSSMRDKKTYSDITIACAGKFYSVHKFVLSTCSDYFVDIIEKTPCKHPIIVLKDIRHQDLEALLNYMYLGEVNVLQNELAGLIKAAECLRIKGLAVPDESPPPHPGENTHKPVKSWEEGSPHAKRRRHEDESTNSNSSPPRKKSNSRLEIEGIVETAVSEDHSEKSENNTRENVIASVQQAQEQPNNTSENPGESSLPVSCNDHQETHDVENPIIKVEEEDVKYEDEEDMHLPDTCNALEVQMVESDGSSQGTIRNNETRLKYESSLPDGTGGAPLLPSITQQYSTHPQSFEEIVSQALPGPSGIQGDAGQSWDGNRREGDMTSFHLQGFSQQDRLNPHHRSLQQVDSVEDTVHRVRGSVCSEGSIPRGSCTLGQYGMEIPQLADSRMDLEIRQAKEWRCFFPECGYVTDRESWLRQHFRRHTGEKPFPCPYCSFRSAQKGNLNVHVKRVHCAGQLPSSDLVAIKPDYLNIS
ncbi:zinc finger and BTB domain-containing protein 41 isoform X2 [Procambarus clarkii]|uniref:zinc finger and BTB domain-containing protein 41 isoform X2 n=1 Tax=Procambarus clarkii TaxID=6728 RepID=UPI0037420571